MASRGIIVKLLVTDAVIIDDSDLGFVSEISCTSPLPFNNLMRVTSAAF